jgi:mannose-1-phosphate guanylyltransferase
MDHAIVMAGGSGTRFWPESRLRRSKQFLNLTGDGPMIVETVRRLFPLVPRENVWVVAGEKDAPHLKARTLGVPPRNILLEPQGRNTAPAVALAALIIERRDQDAVIAATPADHAVADAASFRSTLRKGFRLARSTGRFVTLGITPAHPATGYGYIERGAPYRRGGKGVYLVRRFTEKPDLRTARKFLRAGRFFWNSGVFLVRAETYRNRMARFLPPVQRELERAVRDAGKRGLRDRLRRAYARIPSISVDYGILEKEEGILVIPSEFGWSDIGTWRSLHEFLRGEGENVTAGNVILSDCRGTLVRSDGGVVAVIGMEDVVVVRDRDAVLVCPRHRSEEVKEIAEKVRGKFPGQA